MHTASHKDYNFRNQKITIPENIGHITGLTAWHLRRGKPFPLFQADTQCNILESECTPH